MPDDDLPTDPPRTTSAPDTDRNEASAERGLIEARREKAREVRELAVALHNPRWNPFANDVKPTEGARTVDVAAARALADAARDAAGRYDDARVRQAAGDARLHVRGRVM